MYSHGVAWPGPLVGSVLGLVLGLVLPAAGQSGAVIEGTVMGPNNRPVGQVRITVMDDGYAVLMSAMTDASGRFRARVGAGAMYYVDVEPTGQAYKSKRIQIDGGPSTLQVVVELEAAKETDRAAPAVGLLFQQSVPVEARREYEGAVKILAKKPDEAHERLRKALRLYPDYYDAMEALGFAYVKADFLDFAVPILAHAVEVNPSGERSHYALGVAYFKLGRYADAERAFARSKELNARSVNTTLYLGLASAKLGKGEKAEVHLKSAYEMGAKGVPDLHLALANIYIDARRYEEAVDQLRTLLRETPDMRDKDKILAVIERLKKY
jgi:tetratricopeptide (TPR) repeat protein